MLNSGTERWCAEMNWAQGDDVLRVRDAEEGGEELEIGVLVTI